MDRSYLFYAANIEPEVNRIETQIKTGNKERAEFFVRTTLKTLDALLSAPDISPAGREEWTAFRNLLANYLSNDGETNKIILSYGVPFSQKFARRLTQNLQA